MTTHVDANTNANTNANANADSATGAPAAVRPHDHVLFTDLDGVEGVVVDLNTKQYYQLNETASLIWRELAAGTPAAEIARRMTASYDVTLEHAQASVDTAIRTFAARQLLGT